MTVETDGVNADADDLVSDAEEALIEEGEIAGDYLEHRRRSGSVQARGP
ncbi:Uncharacterised protein [Mycobacteroides abscessus subsp. abscessus]|nr:Uncharacterised protein [Mycobacteroides abscessus subsp. abscessus]